MHLKTTPTACGNLAASEANFSDLHCLKQAFTRTAAYFRLSACIPSGIRIMKDQVEGTSFTETDFFPLNHQLCTLRCSWKLPLDMENYHLLLWSLKLRT